MTHLRFGVLGPLEVFRDGHPVAVPPGRRRAVLACLLVHAGRPVAADVLIEAAWREDLPHEPRAALHTVLSRLRTILGADALVSEAAGYALAVGDDAVDAHRFESLRTQASSAPPDEAVATLREALALWRGRAYEEFAADHDFAAAEAQRLERLRLDTVEEHSAVLIDGDHHEEAAARLEALLEEHPFRERAVELLMTALYRAGRQADALARCRAHRRLLRDELGLDPSPAVSDLESRILGHTLPWDPGQRHGGRWTADPGDAPTWLDTSTGFFGRDGALADLVAAVGSNRLVTVTGVGGVGKTRLVAEALASLTDRLQVPITVVELAPVQPGRVSTAVADALGLSPQPDAVDDDVLEYLSIARGLVVLDNCEHLRAEAARFAGAVTRRCPRMRLLATSRHRLGTASERVVPLAPLPVAGRVSDPAELEANPAVRLFVDRVRRLRPSFGLSPENAGPVSELCRRLDGLPLALELAASRTASLGVETVLGWFQTHPAEESLQDLRSVVEWSTRLLTPEQRQLLAHLAVFADDFSVDDATDVGGRLGPWEDQGGVVRALEELVESNLVTSRCDGAEMHLRMLALVRSFAAQQLAESAQEGRGRLAHAEWVSDVVERAAQEWITGHAAVANTRLVRIGPDMNAALRWALATGRLDVAAPITGAVTLCMHWLPGVELGDLIIEVAQRCVADAAPECALGIAAGAMTSAHRGDLQQTRQLAVAALDASPTGHARLLACMALAVSTFYSGDHEESAAWLQRAANLSGLAPGHLVEPHITRALLACAHDDLAAARGLASVALAGSEAAKAEAARSFALYASGEIEARDDPERGAARFREAAAEAERIGSAHVSHVSRLALFALLVRSGQHQEALDLVVPLLQDVRRAGAWPQVWTTLRIAAELLAARGRREDAALLLAAAEAARNAPPLVGKDVDRYANLWEEIRRHLGGSVVAQISDLAAATPRSHIVDRATILLAGVP